MSELVFLKDKEARTSSRIIAENFRKRHDNVLRKIQTLETPEDFNRLNFEAVDYIDAKGETRQEYIITRDGFMILVMGFTGKKAAQIQVGFVAAFNAMEKQLSKDKYGHLPQETRALLESIELAQQAKTIAEEATAAIKDLREDMLGPDGYYTVVNLAKELKQVINRHDAMKIGKLATKACIEQGILPQKVRDPRYGTINCYPREILEPLMEVRAVRLRWLKK